MNRTIEQWTNCDPMVMAAKQSWAARFFTFADAKHDILILHNKNTELLEVLQKAKEFIENGIELGYIRMPDLDTPDAAHRMLPMINAAIAAAKGE